MAPPTSAAASTSQSPQSQPKTLDAATAAAQEKSDRYASGDFAGEWMLFSKQLRDAVSQADYVTFAETCAENGLPITVTGVRMDGPDRAIVRVDVLGIKSSRTMVYEDGQWVQVPTEKIAQHLGKPIEQWIADERIDGKCLE